MKRFAVLALLIGAAVAPINASAKGVATLVVVGSDGRSITIHPEQAVLAVMLYSPASVYNRRSEPTIPRGGYVKIYPLGSGGFPAITGRFYPATRALCFAWDQATVPACGRLGVPHRLLGAARRLSLFHGRPTTLSSRRPGSTGNLSAALELAFDRHRASYSAGRPLHCLAFVVVWNGPQAPQRPSRFCVSRRGVYARGRLYPAGPAIWWLARHGG
jgi:hypothetical protein